MYPYPSFVDVTAPSDVGTHNRVTVDLRSYGFDAPTIARMRPRAVARTTSAGVGQVLDDTVTISGHNLIVAEGTTGFAAGDTWRIELGIGVVAQTGVAATV